MNSLLVLSLVIICFPLSLFSAQDEDLTRYFVPTPLQKQRWAMTLPPHRRPLCDDPYIRGTSLDKEPFCRKKQNFRKLYEDDVLKNSKLRNGVKPSWYK